ncbi:MAG: cation diffusion facilitator family transporter [Coriobacteriia bacterium]|nr:cation diffusion facilitator family transporter [Coriobacteriia bacterium]
MSEATAPLEYPQNHTDRDHDSAAATGHDHGTASGHSHAHSHASPDMLGPKLLVGIGVNLFIVVIQIIGGLLSSSLSLLSDAAHNMSDVMSLVLSYGANRICKRPPTPQRTFAFRRAEVLVAFVNASGLMAIAIFIAYEGVGRLLHPVEIGGLPVMLIAGIGMVANAGTAFMLKGDDDLNARSAFLHLMADAVTSLGVVIGGALVWVFGFNAADSIVSIVLAVWMVKEAWSIVRESANILLEGAPDGIDFWAVADAMAAEDGVLDVHALHVWAISSKEFALSAHIEVDDERLSDLATVVRRVKKMLAHDFGIAHPTLEIEAAGKCAGGVCTVAIPMHDRD